MPHSSPGWVIDAQGVCPLAEQMPSPNQDARPPHTLVDLIVIHNISLPPGQFGGEYVADLFLNRLDYQAHPYFAALRTLRVSAHFFLSRQGRLFQFVATENRAWHAGVSDFMGRAACNDFSVGIELEGTDDTAFTPAQYDGLALLTVALCRRYRIAGITGHQQIAPARKTDPGARFDWVRYERQYRQQMDMPKPDTPKPFPVFYSGTLPRAGA
ncbi:MAG: 1,6-anhydro-N-acetylmuramyl-L-alanine amidase AmpD [Burkholderiaceae bacterium]|jgi:AmpD protein|nr:1,6-anhydro-N-acetylmuramyl-L-alanine amidase AmpD [Burkholderiaceae bacterium]